LPRRAVAPRLDRTTKDTRPTVHLLRKRERVSESEIASSCFQNVKYGSTYVHLNQSMPWQRSTVATTADFTADNVAIESRNLVSIGGRGDVKGVAAAATAVAAKRHGFICRYW
jgi:hypothetical protein